MTWSTRTLPGMAMVVGLLLAFEAHAASVVVPPRPGQVGFGFQGQYGMLMNSGDLGESFGSGPGLAVRVRYRMRYERGLGLSFEAQRFDVRDPAPPESLYAYQELTTVTQGIEFYQMFGTRTHTTRMLSIGVGLEQNRVRLNDGETIFPNDGLYLSAGVGLEHFFWQSWAYDLSGRYLAVFQNGKTNHDVHASLGLIFYASY